MRPFAAGTLLGVLLTLTISAPVAASDRTDTISGFGTVLAVARPADFPVASLMRADCAFVRRVEQPDGSAVETQSCQLSTEPVMIPEFQGTAPDRAFLDEGGPCLWASDYWFSVNGSDVYASSYRLVVSPSGSVQVRALYPAIPLSCG